jgi:hypothetical protein
VPAPEFPYLRLRAFGADHVFAYGTGGFLVEHVNGAWLPPEETGIGNKQITSTWLGDDGGLTIVGEDGLVVRKDPG